MMLFAATAEGQSRPASAPATPGAAGDPRVTPIVLAYQKARPSVVSISAEKVVTAGMGMFGADPFEEIFPMPMRRVPVQSLGSGVIVHPAGYIVTNAHVVRLAEKINVTLADKTQLPARVIIADGDHDFALLKVDAPSGGMAYMRLGRSDDLMVGETVVAIGNPMGYANSVTTGVISALERTMEFGANIVYKDMIQTDAPINPGNSGGPLLNINGELIGVNVAIRADAQNIGFAIPVDALAAQIAALVDFERLNRVTFGAAVSSRHGSGGDEVLVTQVRKGTPADGAFQAGDRLLAIDAQAIGQIPDFACAMLGAKPDRKLAFKVLRSGKELVVEITPAGRPKPDGNALAQALMGMTLKPITPELAREMRLRVDSGLIVVGLDDGGPADKLGVKLKDVIFQIDRYMVSDMNDLGAALDDVKGAQAIRLGIARQNARVWTPLTTRQEASTKPAPPKATQPSVFPKERA
jgi:serine protease Do